MPNFLKLYRTPLLLALLAYMPLAAAQDDDLLRAAEAYRYAAADSGTTARGDCVGLWPPRSAPAPRC